NYKLFLAKRWAIFGGKISTVNSGSQPSL
nr:hypothetical protein [Tanacetum cinerariifolium]